MGTDHPGQEKNMKKIIWAFGFFALFVVSILLAPGLIDWNQFKDEIQGRVSIATGSDVQINGHISIAIFPAPALVANDVSLDNVNGAKAKSLMHLRSLEVIVALAPLLAGQVKVKRVRLVDPTIELEVLSDGQKNWVFESGPTKSETNGSNSLQVPILSSGSQKNVIAKSESKASAFVPPVSLDSLSIENGTIIYRDSIDGTFEKIEALDAKLSAASIKGPFEASGDLIARGLPITFNFNAGEIIHGRTLTFALRTATKLGDSKIFLNGTLVGLEDIPRIKGSIKGEAKSLAAFINTAKEGGSSGPLNQRFSFEANIAAWSGGGEVKGLELRLGNTKVSGDISAKVDKIFSFSANLGAEHINLDSWLSTKKTAVSSMPNNTSGSSLITPLILGGKTSRKLKGQNKF